MKNIISIMLIAMIALSSCVGSKKYKAQVKQYDELKADCDKIKYQLSACLTEKENQGTKIKSQEGEIDNLRKSSNALLQQLSEMSVLTAAQSASIQKSLENIGAKDAYIQDLQSAMTHKDSLNMALIMNLKGALNDVNDEDVQIKVEGSAVLISISDKMLFKSGKYEITPRAKEVLGKVAQVVKAQPDIQFMVEGHTDNKPIVTASIKDNW